MPKVHNIGTQHFMQYMRYPAKWGWKIAVKGWTQEIDSPFRTAEPWIIRLPFYRALIIGRWTGRQPDEESALNNAIQGRILTDEDFEKEKGWTPAPRQDTSEDSEYLYW